MNQGCYLNFIVLMIKTKHAPLHFKNMEKYNSNSISQRQSLLKLGSFPSGHFIFIYFYGFASSR